jgi:hypothetical protein
MSEPTISELKAKIAAQTQELAVINPKPEYKTSVDKNFVFDDGLFLSLCLLVFSMIVFSLMTYLIKIGKQPDQILKVFGSVLIVVAAVFLIVAGYSEKQISPVIGLLGTVAGYILGRSNEKRNTHEPPGSQ